MLEMSFEIPSDATKMRTERIINLVSIALAEMPFFINSSTLREAPIETKVAMPRRVPMMLAIIYGKNGMRNNPAP